MLYASDWWLDAAKHTGHFYQSSSGHLTGNTNIQIQLYCTEQIVKIAVSSIAVKTEKKKTFNVFDDGADTIRFFIDASNSFSGSILKAGKYIADINSNFRLKVSR